MEGNLSAGNMIQGCGSYAGIDLQGSMRVHHHQLRPLNLHQQHQSLPRQRSVVPSSIHENFALTMSSMPDCDQSHQTINLADFSKGERGKNNSASDEDEPSLVEDTVDGQHDVNRGKKGVRWHRVKWTENMVRLLITAVSYIGEDAASGFGSGVRRKYANIQKKGKWKSVSKVMAERGHHVSPQQCEDKFNDLNKRYKRLNEILGRGTSCEVVEKPELLDFLDYVSDKGKEEVRKILSSKHLFYEEMCSYHNGNRLHLPHDPDLQRSLRLALRSHDDHTGNDTRGHPQDSPDDDDDQDAEHDDRDEFEESHSLHGDPRAVSGVLPGGSVKRARRCHGHQVFSLGSSLNSLDCNKKFISQNVDADMSPVLPESMKGNIPQSQWMKLRSLQLEEQKLQLEAQTLELEKERLKWHRFCKKKDTELEIMRMENERMKLENERMILELRQKELGADCC